MNYPVSRPGFEALGIGVRGVLTNPSTRTSNLYAATNGQFPAAENSALISTSSDHRFSENDYGFLRLNYTWFRGENQATGALNAVSRGRQVESPSFGLLFSETHIFDSNTINEFRAQF